MTGKVEQQRGRDDIQIDNTIVEASQFIKRFRKSNRVLRQLSQVLDAGICVSQQQLNGW